MEKQFLIPMTETEFENLLSQTITDVMTGLLTGNKKLENKSNAEDDLILFEEALSLLKCSGPTLYKFTRDGLKSYKIGNKRFFRKREVLEFITQSGNRKNDKKDFALRKVF
jgi:predicted DNA-binding transcriptional regulator AlpA